MVKKRNVRKFWKLGMPEYATGHFGVNKNGELVVFEGNYQYNIKDLCDRFGTSLELVFPHIIEERLEEVFDAFKTHLRNFHYRGKFYFHYPMKANQTKEFVLPIVSEGAHLETSSANELWIVKRMWEQEQFSTKIRVLCNGPKTNRYISLVEELKLKGLEIIPIIENYWELEYLRGYRGDVGLRMDPGVKVESHWDKRNNQFGFNVSEIQKIGKVRNLKILSYHIGKQTIRIEDIIRPLRKAMELFVKLKKKNPQLDAVNMGGGFAVPFEKNKKLYTVDSVARRAIRVVKSISERAGIPHPDIIAEWGSYLVAPAQMTIYKVIAEKPISNSSIVNRWYFMDGSFMNDLLDTWAIRQKWHVVPVNNMDTKKFSRVWLSGSSCDSDDRYTNGGEYVLLPRIEDLNGDPQYVAFFDTGAYQDALASHHCLLSSPAKLVIQNGLITVARKRESPEEVGKQFGW